MDPGQFDHPVRALASALPRRQALRGIGSATLALLVGMPAPRAAEASKRKCRQHKRRCKQRCHKHKSEFSFVSCSADCSKWGWKNGCGDRAH